ncbi:MAG: tRNA (adenosine(37)-N6)-threonylcarbamoyltransferase complex ATPase subunit type 1 TsaE [Myxococcales bacterium]|nr:tRNA (adenosine(37)-N6)-threonylcarbamoyltransferase complex ATPase subunit type 1 TsaE [Myxococcales bacterium]
MQESISMLLETREATQAMARRLATHIIAGDVILLDGELGAGKTFFAGALIHALGVPEQMFVTSPTFTLIHSISRQAADFTMPFLSPG